MLALDSMPRAHSPAAAPPQSAPCQLYQLTVADTIRALRSPLSPLPSPTTQTITSWNPSEPDLENAAQAPKSQVDSSTPSALPQSPFPHQSSPISKAQKCKTPSRILNHSNSRVPPPSLSTPRSPTSTTSPKSPREKLEAFFRSERVSDCRISTAETRPSFNARLRKPSALPASPPMSPKSMATAPVESRPALARNASQETQSSTMSSRTSESALPKLPSEVAGLMTAAGSAEAALLKLWKEKQGADSQNAQMWRLVEKQRAMILGLNKDLERAVRDRDRYRKKFKEVTQNNGMITRTPGVESGSRAQIEVSETAEALAKATPVEPGGVEAEVSSPSRAAPPSLLPLTLPAKSTRSAESTAVPSVETSPITSSSHVASGCDERPSASATQSQSAVSRGIDKSSTPRNVANATSLESPPSPPFTPPAKSSRAPAAVSETATIGDVGSFSPRGTRKGAPAPLNLAQHLRPEVVTGAATPTLALVPSSKPGTETDLADDTARGRRRTRQDDERVREALVVAQEEARSLSKKSKKGQGSQSKSASKSQSKETSHSTGPSEKHLHVDQQVVEPAAAGATGRLEPVAPSTGVRRSNPPLQVPQSAPPPPPLMSPGLPHSPRPGDRPGLYSPSPRLPKSMALPPPPSPRHIPSSPRLPLTAADPPASHATATSASASPAPVAAPSVRQPTPAKTLDIVQSSREDGLADAKPGSPPSALPENVFRGLMSDRYPTLLLSPHALSSVHVKVFSSRLRPSRHSLLLADPNAEDPVFLLGIYARSTGKQLWRLEKTTHSLPLLHRHVVSGCGFDGRLPDRALFLGHAPAKIDARRAALNAYFDLLLDTQMPESVALVVCNFFSSNVMEAEDQHAPGFLGVPAARSPPSISDPHPHKEGFLTKRGKNFGGWKARYFILDGPELCYYDGQGGPQIGVIKLFKAQIGKQSHQACQDNSGKEEDVENQYRHAFLILEPKKKDSSSLVRHVLCAESDEERDAWVAALLKYVDSEETKEGRHLKQTRAADGQPEMRDEPSETQRPKRKTATRKEEVDAEKELRERQETPDSGLMVAGVPGFSYDSAVPGDQPIQGTTASGYNGSRGMISPPLNGNQTGSFGRMPEPKGFVNISGPSNGSIIQNSEAWGFRNQTPVKDKKRSIFGFHRARTPSDTVSGQSSGNSSLAAPVQPLTRPVFGMPLAEAVHTAPPADVEILLPAVVFRCLEYLVVNEAANEEGIFRLSGSQSVIKALRERFNTEGDVRLLDGNYYDVHAVASLLKLYLRELPSSVLTRDLHLEFLKALEIEHRRKKIAALNMLVHTLPAPNLELVSNLCSYLADVANTSNINRMNVRNVAIVFAPTLNIPAPLIQLFITEYDSIFNEIAYVDQEAPPAAIAPSRSDGLRSPRHQNSFDLPTPVHGHSAFSPQNGFSGFQPMGTMSSQPPGNAYTPSRTQFSEAMFPTPPVYQTAGLESSYSGMSSHSMSSPAESSKRGRRESSMMGLDVGLVAQRQMSRQTLRDTSSSRGMVGRDVTPERRL